jgi:hypothetical protein
LKGYTTIVDSVKLGYALTAVTLIQVEGKHLAEVEKEIAQLNEAICVYDIYGDFDIIVVAKFSSRFAMTGFIKDMKSISHVRRAVTSLVLNVVKEGFKVSAPATPEQAQIAKLWQVYVKSPIEISAGNKFPSVDEWVRRRKQVYVEYRKKFSPSNLSNLSVVKRNFQSWLLFRNNLSWSTLQGKATPALEHPEKIAKLLLLLQNEDMEIASRVRNALQGPDKIGGIGQGIVTALLHTFNNDKYGVWNSRTIDTLKKLHRTTFQSEDIGESYKKVNYTLNQIATELNTDLTTLDGFMLFISKNCEFV